MTAGRFHWKHFETLSVVVPDFFVPLGLAGGFTTRTGSNGRDLDLDLRASKPRAEILENRRIVAGAMGVAAERFIFAEQVHGDRVEIVTAAQAGAGAFEASGAVSGADALVTDAPGVPLAGLSADCPVVLLAASYHPAVAAVHSGWRGTAAGVVTRAVEAIDTLGAHAAELYAAIGPAIGPCCYEVGDDVREAFPAALAAADGVFTKRSDRLYLDLAAAIRRQLLECGVIPDRISAAPWCTSCEEELFYS